MTYKTNKDKLYVQAIGKVSLSKERRTIYVESRIFHKDETQHLSPLEVLCGQHPDLRESLIKFNKIFPAQWTTNILLPTGEKGNVIKEYIKPDFIL